MEGFRDLGIVAVAVVVAGGAVALALALAGAVVVVVVVVGVAAATVAVAVVAAVAVKPVSSSLARLARCLGYGSCFRQRKLYLLESVFSAKQFLSNKFARAHLFDLKFATVWASTETRAGRSLMARWWQRSKQQVGSSTL